MFTALRRVHSLPKHRLCMVKHAYFQTSNISGKSWIVNEENAEQIQEINDSLDEVFGSIHEQQWHQAQANMAPLPVQDKDPRFKVCNHLGSYTDPILGAASKSVAVLKSPIVGQVEPKQLSHTDGKGEACMVDVGSKKDTSRFASASGRVVLGSEAFQAVKSNSLGKGDVLSVARIAGIMAAKQTANLIPLCHALSLDRVAVKFTLDSTSLAVDVSAEAWCTGKTGVEMEAMTAATVAALTIYDMCKAVTKEIRIENIQLDAKTGGKSGNWRRQQARVGFEKGTVSVFGL